MNGLHILCCLLEAPHGIQLWAPGTWQEQAGQAQAPQPGSEETAARTASAAVS